MPEEWRHCLQYNPEGSHPAHYVIFAERGETEASAKAAAERSVRQIYGSYDGSRVVSREVTMKRVETFQGAKA